MTTEEILQSIEGNLSNAYSSLEKRKKVTMPEKKNFENLATTIDSIEPLLEEITIEAKTTNQLFTPSGENEGIGRVNVKAVTSAIDPNIIPTNIRKGKTILGVVGNVEADKPDQEKTVNPTTSQQSVVADTGYELAKVTINAVTKSIDANIKAENIKQGVSILGVQGSFQGSKAPALQEKIVEPSIIAQEITADSGYDGISKITVNAVTSKIDSNIQADNIKEGVEILGVLGTHQGGSLKFAELVNGTITSVEAGDLADVTMIRDGAFEGVTTITRAVIPSNVISVGESAFAGCSNLNTLVLEDGLQTIGANAFNGINASVIELPSTLTSVGESAFANNTVLSEVTIPISLSVLPAGLFSGCTSLINVTMEATTPPSVTDTTFPSSASIYVKYGAYDDYVAQWSAYASQIVRLPAIPSAITITVNNYLGELVSGASVTITGSNGETYAGTTDGVGVFTQGDLQPATYTITVADIDGFKTPNASEVVVLENTQNSVSVTYLEKQAFSTTFGENTPEQISTISAEISANNMTSKQVEATYGWKIGDTISYQLTTGENVEMRIIGFNHDNKSDGSGKAEITLEMTHCLAKYYSINSTTSGTVYYSASDMKNTHLPAIKATLPQEWQDVIKLVDKNTYESGMITSSEDLFLLSEYEVYGARTSAKDNEGSFYEYWRGKSDNDRIKKAANSAKSWWLRSAGRSYNNYFCMVFLYSGGTQENICTNQLYVSYAFCI
jgi:hypothetical protein